jgi:hypothetical protein
MTAPSEIDASPVSLDPEPPHEIPVTTVAPTKTNLLTHRLTLRTCIDGAPLDCKSTLVMVPRRHPHQARPGIKLSLYILIAGNREPDANAIASGDAAWLLHGFEREFVCGSARQVV